MLRPPFSLLTGLVATTSVITVTLGWFGSRMLEQERVIDRQRSRQQVETSADALAADMRTRLAEAGERLSDWLSNPRQSVPAIQSAVVLANAPAGMTVVPAGGLPFVPVTRVTEFPSSAFAAMELLEFAAGRLGEAAAGYRALARDADPRVRAGALLRLGRVLRKSGDFDGALAAYRQLTALGATSSGELPADLVGLEGQRASLIALGDLAGGRRMADEIIQGIVHGRWPLPRGVAVFYYDELTQEGSAGARVKAPRAPKGDAWLLADAVTDLWRETDGRLPARGQRALTADGRGVLLLWRSAADRAIVLSAFTDQFFGAGAPSMIWQLVDPDDRVIGGVNDPRPGGPIVRVLGDAQSPWTLRVWPSATPAAGLPKGSAPLLGMMAATLVCLWGATYFMGRALRREANLTRLQSDFVAAVSHEFRSPLTTIRQMAEMLEMDRLPDAARRRQYYSMVAAEAGRLQNLVETLLNFGRMQAGAAQYRFSEIDAASLVQNVVRGFERHPDRSGNDIETVGRADGILVRADEAALSVALRNIVENAVKYSPDGSPVRIEWRLDRDCAEIVVTDRGPGIPRSEHAAIFRKFVRGRAAVDANVKGTGVGLSMAREIVLAHGGEIRVDSEPGKGSTFTMALPAVRQARA